jgi:hypothetical protein
MLKIVAAMVASLAVLVALTVAVSEDYGNVAVAGTDTPTPEPATDTPTPAPATATATAGAATATATAAAGTATPTPATRTATPAAVTPAAVPGTGGEPGSSTNLLLILAIGAGLVAGTAGLAGIAVTRRS